MPDKRAQILDRLEAVLDAIPQQMGYDDHTMARNRGGLDEEQRPAIVLLDGVEEAFLNNEGRGRTFMTSSVMTLLPQIFVLLVPRKTPDNAGVGDELTAFRNAVIGAIANDQQLASLCGSNGEVSLRRVETDMQNGALLEGQLRLDFAFKYVLDPYNLT